MRALVVDDDLATRTLVAGLVRSHGITVMTAGDGDEAWALFQAEPFPLVVTDWMMPNVTGVELVTRIRAVQPSNAYCYALVVTSLSAREHTLTAFEAGADDMLTKPVDAAQIAARIGVARRFLDAHTRRAEDAFATSLQALQGELGHDHVALAHNLSALSSLYRGRGAWARARAFVRREIDLVVQAQGAEHPRVAQLRAELASLADRG